jgi:hypothetical protein
MTSDNISKGANAHIREYLDYYCHLSNPKFAVLLKGPWGSGKTWLIKKFMDDFKLIKDLNQSTSNFKFLYISLYGMQTLEEVEREFLRQLYSFSGSRELEFLAESISKAIQFNLSLFPFGIRIKPTLSLKNLPEYFKNVDQRILIFDDLERCHVEIDHVLGYINSFIEHKSAKVIIVANEEKLYPSHDDENQQQRHKYQYIKEKIIGQTLEVKFSFQETIESLMKDLYKDELIQNEEVESFIKTQSETIEIIYQNAEYKNIRTLRKIILDFNRIWASLPANVIQKEEAIQELFELLIMFSIGIHKGVIATEFIGRTSQFYKDRNKIDDSENLKEAERLFYDFCRQYESFLGKYLSNRDNLFPSYEWWEIFFNTGVIDQEKLKISIRSSSYFRNENTPNWLKLHQYKTLTDDQFDEVLSEVKKQFDQGQLVEPEEAIHVFGVLLKLSKLELVDEPPQIMKNTMKGYIDSFRKSGRFLEFSNSLIQNNFSEYSDLTLKGNEIEEFKSIIQYIVECNKSDQQIFMSEQAHELLQTMKKSVVEFHSYIRSFITQENHYHVATYHDKPILNFIPVQDFIDAFLALQPDHQLVVIHAIVKRHELDRGAQDLKDEYEWIKKVINSLKIEMHKRQQDHRLSGILLNEAISYFETNISKFMNLS